MNETATRPPSALLVGAWTPRDCEEHAAELLAELTELADTLGLTVAESVLVRLRESAPRYFLGKGKAEELRDLALKLQADLIIFDNELTPAQQRNWEKLTKKRVIDRHEVILDIFARRAHTREARLQVELARLEYALPRLTRAWGHLGRQAGGIGGKGEGESQLEIDRRLTRDRIHHVKHELAEVRRNRATQRKERQRVPVPTAAIVGYTNAGKSSLLRRLTQADVLVEDKLFATLDTTTRRLRLPDKQNVLLTDTVGFIRRLPHDLVEAFKATLEEALVSDFLIHLIDASRPDVLEIHQTTLDVLKELGARDKEILTVLNKSDLLHDPVQLALIRKSFPDAVLISVTTGAGLEDFLYALSEVLARKTGALELLIPQNRNDLIARLYREANVLNVSYENNQARLLAVVPHRHRSTYLPFAQDIDPATESLPSPVMN